MGEDPALQVAAELVFDVPRERRLVHLAGVSEEGLQVLTHDAV
jgi:hypothetical protein